MARNGFYVTEKELMEYDNLNGINPYSCKDRQRKEIDDLTEQMLRRNDRVLAYAAELQRRMA